MRDYLIRRFLLMIPTLLGITFIAFCVTRFVPGGPVEQALTRARQAALKGGIKSAGGSDSLSPEQILQLKKTFGMDRPILLGYLEWVGLKPRPMEDDHGVKIWKFNGMLQGEFGTSFGEGIPVVEVIKKRLPISTFFGVVTTLITYLVCIPLGVLKAVRHRTALDTSTSILIFAMYAIPGFVLAGPLMGLFCFQLKWLPASGFVSPGFDQLGFFAQVGDLLSHTALPLCCFLVGSFAFMTMLMKNQLLDNLAMDYVRTAISKGVSFKSAVMRHAFRNSLLPLATNLGHLIGIIFTGSFLIEKIFDIDGIGLLGYTSAVERDFPVMLVILTLGAGFYLLGNILSDIIVAIVDPRIRFGK